MPITAEQLKELLAQPNSMNKGAYIASIETITSPKMNVKNRINKEKCPWSAVKCHSVINVMGNWNYEQSVNNLRQKEGVDDVESERWLSLPLPWGVRIGNSCFISHKDEIYVQMRLMSVQSKKWFSGDVELTACDVSPYLPEEKDSGRQGTTEAVEVRTYKLSSIRAVVYGGVRYEVV